MPRRHHDDKDPREEMDHSPSSGATDPEDAAQDQAEDYETGRHSYTENETFVKEELPSAADDENRWADLDDLPDRFIEEDDDGNEIIHSKWESLNQANRWVRSDGGDNKTEQRKQEKIMDCTMWADRIGLTEHEQERAVTILFLAEEQTERHYGVEAMTLAAITLAANEGHDDKNTIAKEIRPENPLSAELEDNGDARSHPMNYLRIRDKLDVEPDDVRKCREHLREQM